MVNSFAVIPTKGGICLIAEVLQDSFGAEKEDGEVNAEKNMFYRKRHY